MKDGRIVADCAGPLDDSAMMEEMAAARDRLAALDLDGILLWNDAVRAVTSAFYDGRLDLQAPVGRLRQRLVDVLDAAIAARPIGREAPEARRRPSRTERERVARRLREEALPVLEVVRDETGIDGAPAIRDALADMVDPAPACRPDAARELAETVRRASLEPAGSVHVALGRELGDVRWDPARGRREQVLEELARRIEALGEADSCPWPADRDGAPTRIGDRVWMERDGQWLEYGVRGVGERCAYLEPVGKGVGEWRAGGDYTHERPTEPDETSRLVADLYGRILEDQRLLEGLRDADRTGGHVAG